MNLSNIKEKTYTRLKWLRRLSLGLVATWALGLWAPPLASALLIAKSEPNNSGATAQNVDGSFSLDFDSNITSFNDPTFTNTSTTMAHVSIQATGDGTLDYYRFTSLGGILILDIDFAPGVYAGFNDTAMALWQANGVFIGFSDDAVALDPGSAGCPTAICDAGWETIIGAGEYIVGVCNYPCFADINSGPFLFYGNPLGIPVEGFYTLHISTPHAIGTSGGSSTGPSTGSVPTPEPSTMILLGSGLAGLGAYRRRRSAKKSLPN